jgi:trans-aconitate 2-methyltransferase
MTTRWDPGQYERYRDERARPFFDLVDRLREDAGAVGTVADLGAGTCALTLALLERWPHARVWAVESSQQMLDQAGAVPGRLELVCDDLRRWEPPEPLDRIVSNAALQWVPDHEGLLARLVGWLAPGGVLAVQVPNNRAEAVYRHLDQLSGEPAWSDRLTDLPVPRIEPVGWYHQRLTSLGLEVELWETIYYHRVPGVDGVIEWLEGTTLRPILSRLDGQEAAAFLDELRRRAAPAYPGDACLFPFRRLFFVGKAAGNR